jgi:CheY-like chemotaxis protein
MMNLCINARDAMPEGGKLSIAAVIENGRVEIRVSDTGHGMDRATLEKCFDPFFTTKEVGRGTGLGLSTSYGIIKEHKGDIISFSEVGEGTTFKISLPLAAEDNRVDADRDSIEIIQGRGQRILVVDDEKETLKPMEDILMGIGYRAASVNSGADALAQYDSFKPDVVLMDRSMPGMDGIACTERILDRDPNARVVLISGYDEEGTEGIGPGVRALIAGYLTKPIDIHELSRVLAKIFSA